jgi:glucose-1-phosphate thymidylyltransferase
MVSSAVIVAVAETDRQQPNGQAPVGRQAPAALIPVLDRSIVARAIGDLAELGIERLAVLVDDADEEAVAAAIAADGDREVAIEMVRRDPQSTLTEGIESARFAAGGGPFILHFGGCVGYAGLRAHIGDLDLAQLDAVALMSRFDDDADGPDGAAVPASARRVIGEFHVGIFALGSAFPSALPILEDDASSWMEAALAWMERQGGVVDRRFVTGWWRQRDGRSGILAANRFALAGIDAVATPVGEVEATDSDIQGPLLIDPTARIDSSVIRGPVQIGPDARITDAFVGPFTSIGPGVRIEGAEIESSVVLEGSEISHVDGRLDSSVIGPYATVGKDFRIPRGTRLEVGPGANVMFN